MQRKALTGIEVLCAVYINCSSAGYDCIQKFFPCQHKLPFLTTEY